MKLYLTGDKGKALCDRCQGLVAATYNYRTVPFSDGEGEAKNILVLVCDNCDKVIATPAQSTPAIRAAREVAVKPIELNLPAPFVEALDLAAFRIDPKATTEFRKRLLAYYILETAETEPSQKDLQDRFSRHGEAFRSDAPKRRLSFKVTPQLNDALDHILDTTSMTKTDIIKALVVKIYEDIIQSPSPRDLRELRRLAAVTAA